VPQKITVAGVRKISYWKVYCLPQIFESIFKK
jgi:hypothetical protein